MNDAVLLICGLTIASAMLPAHAYTGQARSTHATISMEQARTIALHAHAGKITGAELEKEAGGSGLRYSFDIRSDKLTQEVGVDAKTGKVLEDRPEGSNPD